MGSVRNHLKGDGALKAIQAILTQPSYKADICGSLPNGEEKYKIIAKKGFQSMKADKALLHRAHYANNGSFGLPQGSGIWLDKKGNFVKR